MLAALIVEMIVLVLLPTYVLFPFKKRTLLLYHQYSTVKVRFSESYTVALQLRLLVSIGFCGESAIAVTVGGLLMVSDKVIQSV